MAELLKIDSSGQWSLIKSCDGCHQEICKCGSMKKDVNGSYGQPANTGGNPPLEQSEMDKAEMKGGFFNSQHLHEVVKMPHNQAKEHAHKIVDTSNATGQNHAKAKMMIDRSKNTSHLAQGMANFMLAHPSEGLKVKKTEEICKFGAGGQWNLEHIKPKHD